MGEWFPLNLYGVWTEGQPLGDLRSVRRRVSIAPEKVCCRFQLCGVGPPVLDHLIPHCTDQLMVVLHQCRSSSDVLLDKIKRLRVHTCELSDHEFQSTRSNLESAGRSDNHD